jgi:outer membrane protein assembly factor BamA
MATKLIKYHLFWLVSFAAIACNPTKFVPQGQYLVKDTPSFEGNEALDEYDLQDIIGTKANRKVLGGKFYLYAYNTGKRLERDSMKRGLRPWLVRQLAYQMGEKPYVLDTSVLSQDLIKLRQAYFAEGYFYPKISYEVDTLWRKKRLQPDSLGNPTLKARQVKVGFKIEEGTAYKIRNLTYDFAEADSQLIRYYNIPASSLKREQNYSHDRMEDERNRATRALRNAGYFSFAPNMVYFEVDTLLHPHEVSPDSANGDLVKWMDLTVQVQESPPRFQIRDVSIEILPPGGRNSIDSANLVYIPAFKVDSLLRDSLNLKPRKLNDGVAMHFTTDRRQLKRLNLNFLANRILLRQGEIYSLNKTRQTQQRLQELGMFRFVLVNFQPIEDGSKAVLDVKIEIQLAKKYQVRIGTEGFTNDLTTSNLPGVGSNIVFRDRNTFRRSEFMELSLAGNLGLYVPLDTTNRAPFYEISANANLNFNRFLLPFSPRIDLSRFSPYTTLAASFNLDQRNEYDRFIVRGKLTYRWNHIPFSDKAVSRLTPIFIDLIEVRRIEDDFATTIENLPEIFKRDYDTRFGSRLQYSFTLQNYGKTRAYPTYWFRSTFEFGGTLPYLIDLLRIGAKGTPDEGSSDNQLFGNIYYGQYLKASFENKWLIPLNTSSEIVVRGVVGGSLTLNNTPSLPYESRFFAGGTNGMRGWLSNTLGPGTSTLEDFLGDGTVGTDVNYSLIAPGGEWLLELNAEYRFDVWTYLEMALFTDVGNVWFHESKQIWDELGKETILYLRNDYDKPIPDAPGEFEKIDRPLQNFRLGWDAGVGFRFDFSFLILRIDLAQQLFAPDLPENDRWVLRSSALEEGERRYQLQIGINYPF